MKAIGDKEKEGVIEPSRAPWCSNALLVRKDLKIRMVIDYRALNKVPCHVCRTSQMHSKERTG